MYLLSGQNAAIFDLIFHSHRLLNPDVMSFKAEIGYVFKDRNSKKE